MKYLLERSSKKDLYITVSAIVILQLLLGFQGFDVCDDGFVLTFYQQFFNAPSSVEYNFVYWFAGLIGGLWYELFPSGGLIWFRLLTIIINTSSFVIAYTIFKPLIGSRLSVLGICVALFVNDFGFLTFYHNQLTILLLLISVYFILKGIKTNHYLSIIFSGFFIGLCVFTRLTNATLFSLVLVFPASHYISGITIVSSLKKVFSFCLGILVGFGLILVLLLLLGQQTIMLNALMSLVDLGNTNGSSHGFSKLISIYVYDFKFLFKSLIKFVLLLLFFIITTKLTSKRKVLNILMLLVNFVLFFYWFKNGNIFVVYVMAYIGAFFVLIDKQAENTLRMLSLMSILALTFLVMGSAGAIFSSGYMCVWLSTPLFFYYFYKLDVVFTSLGNNKFCHLYKVDRKALNTMVIVLFLSFFLAKAYNISKEAYFDKGNRLDKTYTINSKLAKNIYTKKRRAEIINELLVNLKPLVKKDDYLLAYDNIPMIHFLTETKPYMYNSWVWIYDSTTFEKKLNLAQNEIPELPVLIQQKFNVIWSFSEPIDGYLNTDLSTTDDLSKRDVIKKNKILNTFIKNNNYQIVWSNNYFNILKTSKLED